MSDDAWRRGRNDEEEDFGPPLFADDATGEVPTGGSGGLSFGTADTGGLPHWTEPGTGELPRTLNLPVADDTGGTARGDSTGDVDVWSSFSADAPVWSDDPPSGATALPPPGATAAGDDSAPAPRREPGRITIGTDPSDDRLGRPMPKSRSRAGRGDDTLGRNRPAATRGSTSTRTATPPSSRDMPTAVAVGLLLAAAFVGAILWRPSAVLVIIVAVVGLAAVEYFDKVSEKGYHPATVVGIVGCAFAPLATYWVGEEALPLLVVVAFAAACATYISSSGVESNPMPNIAITMLGFVWIGVLGSFGAIIVGLSNVGDNNIGTDTLLLLALGVVANDVGALFVGSAIGKTPLRAWISPNKTVEGFLGGTALTMITMGVVHMTDRSDTWNSLGDLLILGLVISIAAPLGDLTESMFKRNLDVKDFGSLIKGHGGVLDRFDGFLFTLPAVYYLMRILEPWVS